MLVTQLYTCPNAETYTRAYRTHKRACRLIDRQCLPSDCEYSFRVETGKVAVITVVRIDVSTSRGLSNTENNKFQAFQHSIVVHFQGLYRCRYRMVYYGLTSHSTQYRSFRRRGPWAVMYISHSVMECQRHNNPLNSRCFCCLNKN